MLTNETVKILREISDISDAFYQEGGFLYRYTFGHRCAHTDLDEACGKRIENFEKELELFIASAISTPFPKEANTKIKKQSAHLLNLFKSEFKDFNGPLAYFDTDDTSKTLELVYTNGSEYHKLHLFWSID